MELAEKTEPQKIIHQIPPVWNSESEVLILGTMPSPKSREAGFFYMHPQNRFWKVPSILFRASATEFKMSSFVPPSRLVSAPAAIALEEPISA